jgi:hypothetical protein
VSSPAHLQIFPGRGILIREGLPVADLLTALQQSYKFLQRTFIRGWPFCQRRNDLNRCTASGNVAAYTAMPIADHALFTEHKLI